MKVLNGLRKGALILALLVISGCNQLPAQSSLLLGGDVVLYRAGEALFSHTNSALSPWGDLLKVERMEAVDLFAINLESPFGLGVVPDTPKLTNMNFCAEDAAVALLQQGGVDLVTNANNHALDCGLAGVQHTTEILVRAGILQQGKQTAIQFIPVGDQVLAVMSLDDYTGDYDIAEIAADLQSARQASDLVLVSVHWGLEYQAGPTLHQRELAQELIDAGADVVWGHHPHVLQPVEWLRSSVDGHPGLVLFSLGNALSDQWMLPDALRTAIIRIDFKHHKIVDIVVVPLEMDTNLPSLQLIENPQKLDWINQRLGLSGLERKGVTVRLFQWEGGD